MHGKAQYEGDLSDRFQINKAARLHLVCSQRTSLFFRKAYLNVDQTAGVSILSRDDGDFFTLSKYEAWSRVQKMVVRDLLYTDVDAALCTSSAEALQCLLESFGEAH